MAVGLDTGCGQEQYNSELEDLTNKIKSQEKEIHELQTRLDNVFASIHRAHSNIFEIEKSPTPKY